MLIVDDSEGVRKTLILLLGKFFKILEADNSERALIILKANKIDLILIDYSIPEINGLKLLKKIRKYNVKKYK